MREAEEERGVVKSIVVILVVVVVVVVVMMFKMRLAVRGLSGGRARRGRRLSGETLRVSDA